MAGSTRDVTYALRINTEDAKGKIPEVTGEAKASLEGLSGSTVQSGEEFKTWGEKVREAAAGTGKMEVSVTELAHALNEGKINLDQYKAALGPIKTAEDEAALALGRFTDAMRKMGAAEEEPKKLGRAVVTARVAMEGLVAATQKLGKPIPPEFEASIKSAGAQIDVMNAKVGRYKDAVGDMAVKQKLAAQGMETMASRGGSLQGMLGGLADSSEGVAGKFGKIGLAAFGVIEAFKLGYETGEKFDKFLKQHGINLGDVFTKYILAAQGVKDYGNKISDWNLTTRASIGIHGENTRAISGLTSALEKLVPGLKKSDEAIRTGTAAAELWTKQFEIMVKDGQDVIAYGKKHADDIITTLAPALKAGALSYKNLSDEMKLVVKTALEASDAHKHEMAALENATKAIKEKYEAEAAALQKKLTAINESIAADGLAVVAIYKNRDEQIKALNQMNLSQEEYAEKKKKILAETSEAVDAAQKKEEESKEKAKQISDELQKKLTEEATKIDAATEASRKQAEAYTAVNNAVQTFVEEAPNTENAFKEVTKGGSSTAEEFKEAGKQIDGLGTKLMALVQLIASNIQPGIGNLIKDIQRLNEVTKDTAGKGTK